MVSSSKILTVSYGTFSCTLEGFDESFDTMKAIAEYFRDLAQDDRYFGAEPPTPDAEMLARIAEREIARRVEARMENGSYVLRPSLRVAAPDHSPADQLQADQPAAEPAPQPQATPQPAAPATAETPAAQAATAQPTPATGAQAAPQPTPTPVTASPPEATASEAPKAAALAPKAPASETAAAAARHVPPPAAAPDSNSVAAKLQRIRAVVSAGAGPLPAYPEPSYSEDEHAEAFLTDPAMDQAFAPEPVEAEALNADTPAPETVTTEAFAPETVTLAAPETETPRAAAKAEEADAEVGTDGDTEIATIATEDDTEDNTAGENLFADTIAGVLADQDSADQDSATTENPAAPHRAEAEDTAQDHAADAADRAPETPARPRARLLRVKRADFEAAVAAAKGSENEADLRSSLSPEEEADLARELAEVEAELDQAWDDEEDAAITARDHPGLDDLDDLSTEADDGDQPDPRRASGLRLRAQDAATGAETDDAAMLAAVSRVSQPTDTPPPTAQAQAPEQDADDTTDHDASDRNAVEGARKTLRLSSPAHAMLTQNSIEEDDTSVSRILNETNTQLEEPEGNRRRSAIAHLRAAVAATRADRILGRKKDPETATEPYRADLASAVRPRRPMPSSDARSERPAMPRPAPLKLVAEQRVDAPKAGAQQTAEPVRPRRVTRSFAEDSGAMEDEDSGFIAFAEDMGATDLPDLLEAAAAYMSFVEGRDQFSRPQLMTKVRQAEGAESSREDRLRSFGQLLREGKIEKTHGGRFTASDRISFKPGARAAG